MKQQDQQIDWKMDDTEQYELLPQKYHELARTRVQDSRIVLLPAQFPDGLLSSHLIDSCVELPGNMLVLMFRKPWPVKHFKNKVRIIDNCKRDINLKSLRDKCIEKTLAQLENQFRSVPKTYNMCYVDNDGNLIRTIKFDIEVSYTIYPISHRQIILATTECNRTTHIYMVDFKSSNKIMLCQILEAPMAVWRMHCASQFHYKQRHNIIFFCDKGQFCIVREPIIKLFDYILIEYFDWERSPAKTQEIKVEVNDACNFSFVKGNENGLIIWFPTIIVTKPIYFNYFQFGVEQAQIERVIIPRPEQLKQVDILKLKGVVRQGQESYALCLQSGSPFLMTILHFDRNTKISRLLYSSCDPSFQFMQMDSVLGSISRIVYRKFNIDINAYVHEVYYYHAGSDSILCGQHWTQPVCVDKDHMVGHLFSMCITNDGCTTISVNVQQLQVAKISDNDQNKMEDNYEIKFQNKGHNKCIRDSLIVMQVSNSKLIFDQVFATVFMLEMLDPTFATDLVNQILELIKIN